MKKVLFFTAITAVLTFTSCDDDDEMPVPEPTPTQVEGLFIVSNGNYGYGNGSLSFYNPSNNTCVNDVFYRANDMKLGDVAQSMTIYGSTGWIVVNNSNIIYAIDTDSYKVKGSVTGISQPRNMLVLSDTKAYVSALSDNRITIVNPSKYSVTGHIEIPDMEAATGSTEQLIKIGNYVYTNAWSYQKEIIKIDPVNDVVVDRLEVGIQPCSMTYVGNNTLWVLCDGGAWESNPVGYEAPSLVKINLNTFAVEQTIQLEYGTVSALTSYGDNLYWIQNGVQKMSTSATVAPTEAFIASTSWGLYALTVNPQNGDIYVGDAIDYMQAGVVTRYDNMGNQIEGFSVGVCPSGFCWKTK